VGHGVSIIFLKFLPLFEKMSHSSPFCISFAVRASFSEGGEGLAAQNREEPPEDPEIEVIEVREARAASGVQ
jgi:hypothetical protein